jgi:hypothetical protein
MSATQSLVISGRIEGGRVVLDPAFLGAVRPQRSRSSGQGTHTLRLLDEAARCCSSAPSRRSVSITAMRC